MKEIPHLNPESAVPAETTARVTSIEFLRYTLPLNAFALRLTQDEVKGGPEEEVLVDVGRPITGVMQKVVKSGRPYSINWEEAPEGSWWSGYVLRVGPDPSLAEG